MKAVIIDDEPRSHITLKEKLERLHPDITIVASGYNVAEGKQIIEDFHPELVFLDIEMPDGTGLDLIQSLTKRDFCLIFITGHNKHFQAASLLGAIDYLLKPIDEAALSLALLKAKHDQFQKVAMAQIEILQQSLSLIKKNKKPEKISLYTNEGILFFRIENIIRLKAMQNFTEFFVEGHDRRLVASYNLAKYETDLEDYTPFMRVHRSHLINLNKVVQVTRGDTMAVKLTDGEVVPVSRRYRDELLNRLEEDAL